MQLVFLICISFLLLHGSHYNSINERGPLEVSSHLPLRTVTSHSVFLSFGDTCLAAFCKKSWELAAGRPGRIRKFLW